MLGKFKTSLRWRLMTGFLLCAALTGLSGGAGVLSLKQIQRNIKITTEEVGLNFEKQNTQTRQAMSLRALATSISNAKSKEELEIIYDKYRNSNEQDTTHNQA